MANCDINKVNGKNYMFMRRALTQVTSYTFIYTVLYVNLQLWLLRTIWQVTNTHIAEAFMHLNREVRQANKH